MKEMKHMFLLVLLTFFLNGCNYFDKKENQVEWVKESLEESIKKDSAYEGIKITDVVLIRESVSKFTGYVEFSDGAETEKSNLIITIDGEQKFYQCDPPRSLLLRKGIQEIQNSLD